MASSRVPHKTAGAHTYIREVLDALWNAPVGLRLSPRQLGALDDVIRVASDHGLHRRSLTGQGSRCLICEAFERLRITTAEATP